MRGLGADYHSSFFCLRSIAATSDESISTSSYRGKMHVRYTITLEEFVDAFHHDNGIAYPKDVTAIPSRLIKRESNVSLCCLPLWPGGRQSHDSALFEVHVTGICVDGQTPIPGY
jgi:hypothetical protein